MAHHMGWNVHMEHLSSSKDIALERKDFSVFKTNILIHEIAYWITIAAIWYVSFFP